MRATLADVLPGANAGGYAVAGLVVLGWEDARAYARAAAAEGLPVILQAGPGARRHTPLPVLAAMLRHLADESPVPVVAHLDHGADPAECRAALEAGFGSVMFDGSMLPLADNIRLTREVVRMARDAGASVEGEVGHVGHHGGGASVPTAPDDVRRFAEATGVDAVAVSVGNVHLQTEARATIDRAALAAIEAATDVPLVLHGASGIPPAARTRLARETRVAKMNVGTELRQVFGAALRDGLARHPGRFDRIAILSEIEAPIEAAARRVIAGLGPAGHRPLAG